MWVGETLHTIEITHCSITRSKKITPIFSIVYQLLDKIKPYNSERKKVACIYVFINELCPFKQRTTLYFPSISLFLGTCNGGNDSLLTARGDY